MTRRRWILGVVIGTAAVALGWGLMANLSRILQVPDAPGAADAAPAAATAPAAPAIPRIKATLFFVAEDGTSLVGVEQEIPLAESPVAQARAIVEAQLAATPPAPLATAVPAGTTLRALFVSQLNDAFVDLDATVRTAHPGGSLNELITVYAVVNAVAVNLPDIRGVQILIDGREVDTLAGHVDLRRPLRANRELMTP